jgi:D-sedoheptulose 7-phosphate isomerase
MKANWSAILAEHEQVCAGLRDVGPTLDGVVAAIVAAFRAGRRVYIFGNGGSAADAQHIAAELLGRYKLDRPALPALALTTDSSTLTAIANDLGYEQIFARQLEGLVKTGDVAWGLSTSGNSPNVLAALRIARQRGAVTIGFCGAGGQMADLCTHLFRAPHHAADRIQEAHILAYHYVCAGVEAALAEDRV